MKSNLSGLENAAKKWSMPLRDWKSAINQFLIMCQDRMPRKALITDAEAVIAELNQVG